jgi:hypothetical protein
MHLPVKQSIYKQKETKETYPEGTVNQRVLGSSPREGASNEKPLQKCKGFFVFTCQTFVKQ